MSRTSDLAHPPSHHFHPYHYSHLETYYFVAPYAGRSDCAMVGTIRIVVVDNKNAAAAAAVVVVDNKNTAAAAVVVVVVDNKNAAAAAVVVVAVHGAFVQHHPFVRLPHHGAAGWNYCCK